MLGAMFSGKIPTKKDSQGNCFIDRDGKIFRYILNFLRTSHLDLPEDFQEMGLLRREVDFYQIQPLIEALQEKEIELSKAEKNAMLNITLDQKTQTVHFTVREAPQIYSLSSSNMEVKPFLNIQLSAGPQPPDLRLGCECGRPSWRGVHQAELEETLGGAR